MRQLLDVVYQTVKFPLRIDFALTSERESVQLLVVPNVAEYWFHRSKASSVFCLPFRAVDASFHPVGEGFRSVCLALKETHLPGLGFAGGA